MTPVILRIKPSHIEHFDVKDIQSARIQVFGAHFDDSATVHLIGQGSCFETIRVSDTELLAKCDLYGNRWDCHESREYNIGLIVLNDPIGFAESTASNLVPIYVKTDDTKPDEEIDIPF